MATILLTGADGGIGSAIAIALHNASHTVYATTHTEVELTDPAAVHALKEKIGAVDWIVCAHGFIDTETVLERQTTKAIEDTFAVNTLSLFWIAREFLPVLTTGMVVLSSSAGVSPNGRFAAYSASKAAANAFVQAFARNRPEKKFFALCPGPTNTPMRERVAGDAAKMQSPTVVADVITNIVTGSEKFKSGDIILIKDGNTSIASGI